MTGQKPRLGENKNSEYFKVNGELSPLARGRMASGTWRPTAGVQQRLF